MRPLVSAARRHGVLLSHLAAGEGGDGEATELELGAQQLEGDKLG